MRPRVRIELLLLLSLAACTGDDTPIAAPAGRTTEAELLRPNAPLYALAATPHGPETFDEYYARLADSIPGFAGFHYDGDGDAVISLTDTGQNEVARTKLTHFTKKRAGARRTRAPKVRVVKAKHDYKTLHRWRQWVNHNLLNTDGVALTDIDEVNNRIHVGVLTADAADRVKRAAREQGIVVVVSMLAYEDISLRYASATAPANQYLYSEFTTRPGGVQIERGDGGGCSLGFNAYLSSSDRGIYDLTRYFVTAAHCTNTLGQVESTVFSQPTRASNVSIGVEAREPMYGQTVYGGCPAGFRCVSADAALVTYTPGADWELAKIARPTFFNRDDGRGSQEIDPFHPRFTIVDSMELFPRGIELDKVGIGRGWMYGTLIENLCRPENGARRIADGHRLHMLRHRRHDYRRRR